MTMTSIWGGVMPTIHTSSSSDSSEHRHLFLPRSAPLTVSIFNSSLLISSLSILDTIVAAAEFDDGRPLTIVDRAPSICIAHLFLSWRTPLAFSTFVPRWAQQMQRWTHRLDGASNSGRQIVSSCTAALAFRPGISFRDDVLSCFFWIIHFHTTKSRSGLNSMGAWREASCIQNLSQSLLDVPCHAMHGWLISTYCFVWSFLPYTCTQINCQTKARRNACMPDCPITKDFKERRQAYPYTCRSWVCRAVAVQGTCPTQVNWSQCFPDDYKLSTANKSLQEWPYFRLRKVHVLNRLVGLHLDNIACHYCWCMLLRLNRLEDWSQL